MLKMGPGEREEHIEANYQKRDQIRKRIQELNDERKKYVAEKMRERSDEADTLDQVLVKTVRDQAAQKDYKFE
jgi:hypothetical protein